MSEVSNTPIIPDVQADYALRLLEKGYSIAELARLVGCTPTEMNEALKDAEKRR